MIMNRGRSWITVGSITDASEKLDISKVVRVFHHEQGVDVSYESIRWAEWLRSYRGTF